MYEISDINVIMPWKTGREKIVGEETLAKVKI